MALDNGDREGRIEGDLSLLAIVSMILFVSTAAIGAVLVLSRDGLLNKIGNNPRLYFWVALLMCLAICLDLVWLLLRTGMVRRNRSHDWLLVGGAVFFLASLLLAGGGIAHSFVDNGHPNVTNVSVRVNSMIDISFAVHADGVKRGSMVIVEVQAFENQSAKDLLYRSLLKPDENGKIDQSVSFRYKQKAETRLTVRAQLNGVGMDGEDCDANKAPSKLGCATVMLPVPTEKS
ncbi:hypothetical protein [Streptomyces cacaoi]|uniref:hypothetical protein n=1 Tax=Streptomyces cacaoi TaxID=1898 RepID=UPI0037484CA0